MNHGALIFVQQLSRSLRLPKHHKGIGSLICLTILICFNKGIGSLICSIETVIGIGMSCLGVAADLK